MRRRRCDVLDDEILAVNLRVSRILEGMPKGAEVWANDMAVKVKALEHKASIAEYLLKLRRAGYLQHHGLGYVKV